MPRQIRTGADQNRLRAPAHLHRVVRHQAMAPDDEIQRALALADSTFASDEHAKAEHIHQHGVQDRALGQVVFENRRQFGDRRRRGDGGVNERKTRTLGLEDELARRDDAARDQHAGEVGRDRRPYGVRPGACVQALEILDFALAEDEDASRLQKCSQKDRQGQAGLLHWGAGDEARESVSASQQFEREAEGFRTAAQQGAHGDA